MSREWTNILWNIFSKNSVFKIFDTINNRSLLDGYTQDILLPEILMSNNLDFTASANYNIKWRITDHIPRRTIGGLYMDLLYNNTSISHTSFHYNNNRSSSISHIIYKSTIYDIKIKFNNNNNTVTIDFIYDKQYIPDEVAVTRELTELGLNAIIGLGARVAMPRIKRGGGDVARIIISIINIPIDNLLVNLSLINSFMSIYLMIINSINIVKGYEINFADLFKNEKNPELFNLVLLSSKNTISELEQDMKITNLQDNLLDELKKNNELILGYYSVDTILDAKKDQVKSSDIQKKLFVDNTDTNIDTHNQFISIGDSSTYYKKYIKYKTKYLEIKKNI